MKGKERSWAQATKRFFATVQNMTAEIAKAHAESEFEKYRIVQDRLFEIDFDRVVAETKRLGEEASKTTPRQGRKP